MANPLKVPLMRDQHNPDPTRSESPNFLGNHSLGGSSASLSTEGSRPDSPLEKAALNYFTKTAKAVEQKSLFDKLEEKTAPTFLGVTSTRGIVYAFNSKNKCGAMTSVILRIFAGLGILITFPISIPVLAINHHNVHKPRKLQSLSNY